MSITIRTWTDEELEKIANGKDNWLATILMNTKTLDEREIRHYPYQTRKKYRGDFEDYNHVIVFATDDKNLRRFIKAEYGWSSVLGIVEQKTTYRHVELNEEEER